jgi:transposase-like protein
VVNVHCVVAVSINAAGQREVLDVDASEDGAGWLAFLPDLVARGLTGVKLVVSEAHVGLVEARGAAVPGAAWQRYRTHWSRKIQRVVFPRGTR